MNSLAGPRKKRLDALSKAYSYLLRRRREHKAHIISSGSVCRHLKIAGRIAFFMISSGYQPPLAKVATQPISFIEK